MKTPQHKELSTQTLGYNTMRNQIESKFKWITIMTFVLVQSFQMAASTDCSWCNSNLPTECQLDDASGWTLVRAIGASRSNWSPNTDRLQGTDGPENSDGQTYNIGSFEDAVSGYNQFLFVRYVSVI